MYAKAHETCEELPDHPKKRSGGGQSTMHVRNKTKVYSIYGFLTAAAFSSIYRLYVQSKEWFLEKKIGTREKFFLLDIDRWVDNIISDMIAGYWQ